MSTNEVDRRAIELDLERRIALLEIRNYGHATPQCGELVLVRAYLDAHKAHELTDLLACRAWVRQIYLFDVRSLVRVGRAVEDQFPWRPFLRVLDLFVERGIEGSVPAREHLLAVGQDLLCAAGLELLNPRDCMQSLRLQERLAAV